MINFILEKRPDATGTEVLTVVKTETGKPDDEWCTIQDLDRLFETCVRKWGSNWNLEKVVLAIQECEFD